MLVADDDLTVAPTQAENIREVFERRERGAMVRLAHHDHVALGVYDLLGTQFGGAPDLRDPLEHEGLGLLATPREAEQAR